MKLRLSLRRSLAILALMPLAMAGAAQTQSQAGPAGAVLPMDGTPGGCGGTAAGSTDFRAVHFNVLGSTYDDPAKDASWTDRRGVVLKRMSHVLNDTDTARASIYGLTEVTSSEASWLSTGLGPNYAVAVHNRLQAIVFDATTWTVADTGEYTFSSGSDSGHGFVHARLKNTSTGAQVNVIEAHLSPNSVSGAATKRAAQLTQIENTVGSWKNPVLILGDMNWSAPGFEDAVTTKFCSVRVWAGTYYPSAAASYGTVAGSSNPNSSSYHYGTGGSIYDYGLVHGGITMRTYRVLRGTYTGSASGSDHHMLTLHLTI